MTLLARHGVVSGQACAAQQGRMAGLSRVKWDAEDKNTALPPLPSTAGAKVETPTAGESVAEQAAGLGDVTDICGGGDEDEDTYVDIGTLLDLDLGDDSDVDVDEEESDDVFLNRQARGPWISPHGMHVSCIPSDSSFALFTMHTQLNSADR
jgi:hypothetical protein